MKSLFLLAFLILIFFPCCNNSVKGELVDKFYEPPRHYTEVEYDVVFQMAMVKSRYDDEDFVFIIRDSVDTEIFIERLEVSRETYESFRVGDRVDF